MIFQCLSDYEDELEEQNSLKFQKGHQRRLSDPSSSIDTWLRSGWKSKPNHRYLDKPNHRYLSKLNHRYISEQTKSQVTICIKAKYCKNTTSMWEVCVTKPLFGRILTKSFGICTSHTLVPKATCPLRRYSTWPYSQQVNV